jgi:hypothetical protein
VNTTTLIEGNLIEQPPFELLLRQRTRSEASNSDFIQTYADYADVFEMPRQIHEWVAAQMIASVLNGKVQIPWGAVTYPLDLWVLLLSGSGQGRNTATDLALEVMEAAKISDLLHKTTWGSKAAFYQQVAQHPRGLYVWPEFSIALRTLSDPQFAGVKEWITDRYDNLRVPDSVTYRQTGKKSDTPSITFDQAPRINILATSSGDWFVNSLEQADTTGGFIPRWLPKQVGKSDRLISKPQAPNREWLPVLRDRFVSISALTGDADLSQVERLYDKWYKDARARFDAQPNAALAAPFFNRLRGEVLKLAVVFEVSASSQLKVTEQAFQRAVAAALDAEKTIFDLLPTGMNREGSEVERMAVCIRTAGEKGMSQSELTRAFQHVKKRERDERLNTLIDAGRVQELVQKKSLGRPAHIYIDASLGATNPPLRQDE